MANKKISQLTDGTSFQAGDEAVVNRSGTNYKVDPTQFGSSIDVTGTVTADGLTVNKGSDGSNIVSLTGSFSGRYLNIQSFTNSGSPGAGYDFNATSGQGAIRLSTSNARRLLVDNNGDISFYEDTGTTPKFFWDASAESLLVGTDSGDAFNPSALIRGQGTDAYIQLKSATTNSAGILFGDTADDFVGGMIYNNNDNYLYFTSNNSEAMRIDSSGNVGIGTSSPDSIFTVARGLTSDWSAKFHRGNRTDQGIYTEGAGIALYGIDATNGYTAVRINGNNVDSNSYNHIRFDTYGSERMRIDASGRVGIGTSSPAAPLHVEGSIRGYGEISAYGNQTSNFDRTILSHDGASAIFMAGGGPPNHNIIFYTDGGSTERMRIDSSGRMLVGTSSANGNSEVQVQGGIASKGPYDGLFLRVSSGAAGMNTSSSITLSNYVSAGTLYNVVGYVYATTNDASGFRARTWKVYGEVGSLTITLDIDGSRSGGGSTPNLTLTESASGVLTMTPFWAYVGNGYTWTVDLCLGAT